MTRERSIRIGSTVLTILAVGGMVAWSLWQRWRVLAGSPFPLGVDGYYYPIQLRALLEHGQLAYPASPLTFWWMAPFAAMTDPVTGAKLGAALGGALVALPAYGLGARLGMQRGAGLIAAAVCSFSATSAYLTTEFIKQSLGLTVALAATWLVLRALARPSRSRGAAALTGLIAAALTHKLAAALAVGATIPAVLAHARAAGALRDRRLRGLLASAAALALAAVVAGLLAPERFLSPGDLQLAGRLVTSEARWEAPALVRGSLVLRFEHEALAAGVMALIAALALCRERGGPRTPVARACAWAFVVLALAIALPWLDPRDAMGLTFRLRASAFVPLGMCAAIVAGPAARWLVPARPAGDGPDRADGAHAHAGPRDLALAVVAIVIALRAPPARLEGRVEPHPALVAAVLAATTKLPPGATVIVPERHILFMVAWYTRAPAVLRPDGVPHARRVRLLPLHFTGMGSSLDDALDAARAPDGAPEPPLGLHPRHRNGLVLVGEPTWDWLLARVPERERGRWASWPTI